MKKNNNKGFTLVELIVVLVILAILAAILVPALLGYIDKAREGQYAEEAHAILTAAQAYNTEQYAKNADPIKVNVAQTTTTSDPLKYINTIVDPTEVSSVKVTAYSDKGSNASRKAYTIAQMEVTFTSGSNGKTGTMVFDGSSWSITSEFVKN